MNIDQYRKKKLEILEDIKGWTASIASSLNELTECISTKKNFCVDAIVRNE